MAGKVVLNFDEPDTTALVITIDQQPYPFLDPARITPIERHHLIKLQRRSDELAQQADLTDDERAELQSIPDLMARIVVLAPDEVHQKLTDTQRMAIIAAFTRETATATVAAASQP